MAEMPACSLGLASTRDGLPVYILLCPQLYDRPGNPYGDTSGRDWPDNDVRFGRFASAAAQLAAGALDKNWAADLVHANDWQAALVPAYLAWNAVKIPTILTIHNLAYQGLFPKESLRRIGAPEDSFHIDGLEFYDKLSFLKGGIVYASHLTTVSETYAREITTSEFGCGLEGLLRLRSDAAQLTGILNGIDESWDPRVCSQLAKPFAASARKDWFTLAGRLLLFDALDTSFQELRLRRDPAGVSSWAKALPRAASVVAYCVHGHEVSQSAAQALRDLGTAARYLEGGLDEGWKAAGGALDRKPAEASTRWVTRRPILLSSSSAYVMVSTSCLCTSSIPRSFK